MLAQPWCVVRGSPLRGEHLTMETFARLNCSDSVGAVDGEGASMPRRKIGHRAWLCAGLAERRNRRVEALEQPTRPIDWERFDVLLSGIHAARKGQASYPPLMMFKVLLLQRWYG